MTTLNQNSQPQPITLQDCQQYLSPRPSDANKGNFGHVLVIGGDYGLAGSVRLAGEAALRAGAGLVSMVTHPEHAFAISGACPELMCLGVRVIEDKKGLSPVLELLKRVTVVVIGPGLGKNEWGKILFETALESQLPLVVDADGLNFLAQTTQMRSNWILTPHPGEAARLLGQSVADIQKDRLKAIAALQQKYQGVQVLKGAGTLVLGGDNTPRICNAGNPGMAVGGMGDILSGVIAALVAQGLSLEQAASLGVIAHATAGDKIAQNGERGIMARDLLKVIKECLNPQ